jgi:inositol-phosphate phosphatase/L-galactose 1-phosphate phosphatase/histidinol-phosphatase
MTPDVSQTAVEAAIQIADLARDISMKYFRQPLDIEHKADRSPVTIADQKTEALIRDELSQRFPEHGFYGEETGQTQTDAEWVWVVDPIDGTTSFSTGKPTFGTLISLAYKGEPVLGLVDLPALNDRWLGVKGRTTLYNGQPVSANENAREIGQASTYTTTTKMFDDVAMSRYEVLAGLSRFSVFGADCLGYGLLASGFTDIVVEASLEPYDYMALVPVVEGAGGCISDWEGQPVRLTSGNQIVASANSVLHQKVLNALRVE